MNNTPNLFRAWKNLEKKLMMFLFKILCKDVHCTWFSSDESSWTWAPNIVKLGKYDTIIVISLKPKS